MTRPLTLIVGIAAGAILIAGAGVSAHTGGLTLFRSVGMQQTHLGDEASGARTESPEASPKAEPTEKPEPAPTAEPTEKPEAPESDKETKSTQTAESGDHEGDNRSRSGSGSRHGD
jgi:hypothetical protein